MIRDRLYRLNEAHESLGETKILQDRHEAMILKSKALEDELKSEISIVESEKIEALQNGAEQLAVITYI